MIVESPPGLMTSLALASWLSFPLDEWALSPIVGSQHDMRATILPLEFLCCVGHCCSHRIKMLKNIFET